VSDGLSSTAFVSERAMTFINANRITPYGRWTTTDYAATLLYAWNPPNSIFRDWSRPGYKSTLLPNMLASSQHPGGVNLLLGDGSTRFVKESINSWPIDPLTLNPAGLVQWFDGFEHVPTSGVWQGLVTRSGREILNQSDY